MSNNKNNLGAMQILKNFTKDTLITGAIYAMLVVATLILKYFAHQLEDSPIHYKIVVSLEYAIFLAGSAVVGLVIIYLAVISILELSISFKESIAEIIQKKKDNKT